MLMSNAHESNQIAKKYFKKENLWSRNNSNRKIKIKIKNLTYHS